MQTLILTFYQSFQGQPCHLSQKSMFELPRSKNLLKQSLQFLVPFLLRLRQPNSAPSPTRHRRNSRKNFVFHLIRQYRHEMSSGSRIFQNFIVPRTDLDNDAVTNISRAPTRRCYLSEEGKESPIVARNVTCLQNGFCILDDI